MVTTLSRSRPRALMIAPAMPAETGNGLAMRLGLFLEALARVAEVDLIVVPLAGTAAEASAMVVRFAARCTVIPCNGVDTHFQLLSRLADKTARLEAFVRYGRPQICAALTAPILKELHSVAAASRYALVHVGRTYLAHAAQPWVGSRTALSLDMDEDDCETSKSIARLYLRRGCGEKAAWTLAESAAYARLSAQVMPWFDRLWISSAVDKLSLQLRHPGELTVIPNAVTEVPLRFRADDGRTLMFVGSFGYSPNVDAALWFVERVWPAVQARMLDSKLLLVGPDAPARILSLQNRPGIVVTGRVPDLGPIYRRASLALVPVRAGGGTRIKVLEALSHGVPIVATQTGAAGLPIAQHRCGWLADGPHRFASACIGALADSAERRKRAARGRAFIQREHARARVVKRLACSLAALVNK